MRVSVILFSLLFLFFHAHTDAENKEAVIEGTIVQWNIQGEQVPVAGAEVELRSRAGTPGSLTVMTDVYGRTIYTTSTDENGVYRFQIPVGTYDIIAIRLSGEQVNQKEYGPLEAAVETPFTYDIALPAKNIMGQLAEDKTGIPVGPGWIRILQISSESYKSFQFQVDEQGRFNASLPEGKFRIEHLDLGGSPATPRQSLDWDQIFTVSGENQGVNVQVTLPAINLQGQAKFEDGRIIQPNEEVQLFITDQGADKQKSYTVYLQEDGSFSGRFPVGMYQFSFVTISRESESPQTYPVDASFGVTQDGPIINKDIFVRTIPNLTGQIKQLDLLGNEIPLAGPDIGLQSLDPNDLTVTQLVYGPGSPSPYTRTFSDENGNYSFIVNEGSYQIQSIWLNGEQQIFDPIGPITIQDGERKTFPILLPPKNVTGSIREEGTNNIVGPGQIGIHSNGTNRSYFSSRIKEDGTFEASLSPGDYIIEEVYLYPAAGGKGESIRLEQEFTVTDQNLPLSLDVYIPSINIKGAITFSDGKEASYYNNIYLTAFDSEFRNSYDLTVESDGSFSGRLNSGNYQVFSIEYNNWETKEQGIVYPLESFQIMDGMQTPIEKHFIVNNIPNLSGTIKQFDLDGNANLLRGLKINFRSLQQNDGPNLSYPAWVDEEGRYQIALPSGSYVIDQNYLNGDQLLNNQLLKPIVIEESIPSVYDLVFPANNVFGQVFNGGLSNSVEQGNVRIRKLEDGSYYHLSIREDGTFKGIFSVGDYVIDRIYLYSSEYKFINIYQPFTVKDIKQPVNMQVIIPPINLTGSITFSDQRTILSGEAVTLILIDLISNKPHSFPVAVQSNGTFSARLPVGTYLLAEVRVKDSKTSTEDIYLLNKETIQITSSMTNPIYKTITATNPQAIVADRNGDGVVDLYDVVYAAKKEPYLLDIILEFY